MTGLSLVLVAALSAVVAALGMPAVIALARRLDVQDRPGGYKQHQGVVPLLGGLAVAAGTLAGVAFGLPAAAGAGRHGLLAVGAGAGIVMLAGILDDARGLSPRGKLGWQAGAAAAAGSCLVLLDVRLELFVPEAVVATTLLTVLWVVAMTNAANLADHANGLCAGLGALAAAALAAANLRSGSDAVALAASALAGGCLGFLPWNWPRARVFLGDTGSMTIGFTLAALAVLGAYTPGSRSPRAAVVVPLVVLAVPLLDMAIVVALRLRAGQPPWSADRRHLAHRLMRRGLRPAAAVAAAWGAAAVAGLAGWALPTLAPWEAGALLAASAAALALAAVASGFRGLS